MSKQWAQKKSGSNSSLPVQKSSSSQRPFTAPVYDGPAPKQTPSVQAKRRNVDWNRVTVEAQSPAGVQAKLSVGAPGDKYEQEADATANKVMTMPAPEKEKPVQREMASEEKEEEVQTKPLADGIQREMAPEEKEEEVQTKLATEGKSQAGSNLESQLSGTKGGGSALSDEVRSHMEPRFGANFSSVRVHTDSAAVQMNRDLGAQAFTQRAPLIQRIGGKQDTEGGKIATQLRIWKRSLGKKQLPDNVYRLDARTPQVIRQSGFQPYKANGNISIKEHVTGALDQALADGNRLAKYESQYVSTAAYTGLKDTLLAQVATGKYLYKIDTAGLNLTNASFTDVNDYFDRLGEPRPYPQQREWIKQGGIPGAAVRQYMDAQTFYTTLVRVVNGQLVLPNENAITGWQNM